MLLFLLVGATLEKQYDSKSDNGTMLLELGDFCLDLSW